MNYQKKRATIHSVISKHLKGIIQITFPILVLLYFYFVDFSLSLLATSLVFSFISINFIGAVLHRVFAHKVVRIKSDFIAFIMAYLGTVYFTTSPRDWCGIHYLHHRYPDTDKDPHLAMRSWLILKHSTIDIDPDDLRKMTFFYRDLVTRRPVAFFSENFLSIMILNFFLFLSFGIDALIYFYFIPVIYAHLGEIISIQNHYVDGILGGVKTSDEHNGRNGYLLSLLVPFEFNHGDHHDKTMGDDLGNTLMRKLFS